MKVLVTGGAGFIGSHLTHALIEEQHAVVVIDDVSTGNWGNLRGLEGNPRLECIQGSVGDKAILQQVLADVDEVYHLAAAVGVALIAQQPIKTIETNVYTTQLLLDELIRLHQQDGCDRRVFIASSSEVYGKNTKERWTEEDDLAASALYGFHIFLELRNHWIHIGRTIMVQFAKSCFRDFIEDVKM